MANTTYKSRIAPKFDMVKPVSTTPDFGVAQQVLGGMATQFDNEAKTLDNIALDRAQIDFNRGSAELITQYGDDYQGLDKALQKLENDTYIKFQSHQRPELATKLLEQQDLVRLRAVEQARKNYIKRQNDAIKNTSTALLESFQYAMPDDFANYLYQRTLPDDEQDEIVISQWENNITQINELLNRRDMNGNYIFDDKDRKNVAKLNAYKMDGVKQFINSMDITQLKEWDDKQFQNRKKFLEYTGFTGDEYDKIGSYIASRGKLLDNEYKRKVHQDEAYDVSNLLLGNDSVLIDRANNAKWIDKKVVKQITKGNDEYQKKHFYDPDKSVDPTGVFAILEQINDLSRKSSDDPDILEQKLQKSADLLDNLYKNQKYFNISDDDFMTIRKALVGAIQDDSLYNTGMSSFIGALKLPVEGRGYTMSSAEKEALTDANNDAYRTIMNAINYAQAGDIDTAKNMIDKGKVNYFRTANSYWLPKDEFDRLQVELENKQTPLYNYKGMMLEYKGLDGSGPVFDIKY